MATTKKKKNQINITILTKTTIHFALLILLLVSSLPLLRAATAAQPPSPPHLPTASASGIKIIGAAGSKLIGADDLAPASASASGSKSIAFGSKTIASATARSGSKFIAGATAGSGSKIIAGATAGSGSKIIGADDLAPASASASGSKSTTFGNKIIGVATARSESKFIGSATAGSGSKTITSTTAGSGNKTIAGTTAGNKTIASAGNKTIAAAGSKIIGSLVDILTPRRSPPSPEKKKKKKKKKNHHEAREFLTSHNLVRSTHGDSPLQWSPSLARYARRWSEHRRFDCAMEHSLGPYGENMFWGSGGSGAGGWRAGDAVASWASERSFYNESDNECLPGRNCGHFTQIVWGSSERLGCGRSECVAGAGVIITCVYDPPGNFVGDGPFKF